MKIVVTGGSGNVGTALRRHIEFEDVETVGGLVARELARVAAAGDRVTVGDWEFEVESVDGKRIARLLAWPREDPSDAGGTDR